MAYCYKGKMYLKTAFNSTYGVDTRDAVISAINDGILLVLKTSETQFDRYEFVQYNPSTKNYGGVRWKDLINERELPDGRTVDLGKVDGITSINLGVGHNDIFTTDIPIFIKTDKEAINKYLTTGDDSGAIKNVNTHWNLYIDGTKNPLYKLTWDCPDIPSSDTSRVKVIYCDFVESANTFVALSTNYYNYNSKSVKLNYHDIHEAIWGDNDGPIKSAVYIIVQFEYFEQTTVIPKDTSSYMYCELFPNETNGHMFGNIGFCKKGEKTSTFIKTDSGDGSTFTAHDGTEGSDGYTKDDDKGYDDNKDKDDDDTDTQVLSSGIGVLTSTFHMTKERLVQLGQFLWGASIFDEF